MTRHNRAHRAQPRPNRAQERVQPTAPTAPLPSGGSGPGAGAVGAPPDAHRAQTPVNHPTIHAHNQWNPHLLGPITRPLVTTILHHLTTHGTTPRTAIQALVPTAHPKTIETTLDGLRSYGAITGRRNIRLTTLGTPWAHQYLHDNPPPTTRSHPS